MLVFLLFPAVLWSQKLTREQYIEKFKDIAIAEMEKTGIPASITLAQGCLESGNGNSELAQKANNHFGIKCHSSWKGKGFYMDDDAKNECFRVYKNPEESYRDHSDFLVNGSRYNFLFELAPTDYKGWARGLKQAGYATNPKYPELLIKIIEENQLYNYDKKDGKNHKQNSKNMQTAEVQNQSQQNEVTSKTRFLNPYYQSPEIELHSNKIKCYKPQQEESLAHIANKFNMRLWQIIKYNELPKSAKVTVQGQTIFLQPKRRNSKQKTHIVQAGETVYTISQKYGVKTKFIYKRNNLKIGEVPEVGTKIKLR